MCSFELIDFSLKKLASVLFAFGVFTFSATVFGQQVDSDNKQLQQQNVRVVPETTTDAAPDATAELPAGDLQPMMSIKYIEQFCDAWNADEMMTRGLADSEWIDNDGGKGFKIIQLYRLDCPDSPHVEMQFERQDNKAMCVYAGRVENPELDRSADYEMYAETKRWVEIGNGDYGPMKAMMFGRLKFKGPKIEAMGNMGPFKNFLLLFGRFPSDATVCP